MEQKTLSNEQFYKSIKPVVSQFCTRGNYSKTLNTFTDNLMLGVEPNQELDHVFEITSGYVNEDIFGKAKKPDPQHEICIDFERECAKKVLKEMGKKPLSKVEFKADFLDYLNIWLVFKDTVGGGFVPEDFNDFWTNYFCNAKSLLSALKHPKEIIATLVHMDYDDTYKAISAFLNIDLTEPFADFVQSYANLYTLSADTNQYDPRKVKYTLALLENIPYFRAIVANGKYLRAELRKMLKDIDKYKAEYHKLAQQNEK